MKTAFKKLHLKNGKIVTVFILCLFSGIEQLMSQVISSLNAPTGYSQRLEIDKLHLNEIIAPNQSLIDSVLMQKNVNGSENYVVGYNIPTHFALMKHGTWYSNNGVKTCRLKIKSKDAKGISILYSKFKIPESASVFVYNSNFSHKSKAYRSNENPSGDHFSTEIITGDEIILEYNVPEYEISEPEIEIEAISYLFRGESNFQSKLYFQNGYSDECEVNINCSEGGNWQNEKRGIAKVYVINGSWASLCTGTLLNNTSQNCKNYFLTSQHAGAGASSADMNQWQFYFNFESPNCSNLSSIQAGEADNQVKIGCHLRSASGLSSDIEYSNFLLVELNTLIPSNYIVYYNGWYRGMPLVQGGGVSIHHPQGDIKKISTYTNTPQSQNWQGSPSIPGISSHHKVTWVPTNNGYGIVETGSGGAPLFNPNKLVIGQLTGGSAFCAPQQTVKSSLYGKLSVSWDLSNYNNLPTLASFLDPSGSNVTSLIGRNACNVFPPTEICDTSSNFQSDEFTLSAISVPNGNGWIAGSNSFNPRANAELFIDSFPDHSMVTGFKIYFHSASQSYDLTYKIWDATGPNGSPGDVLAHGGFNTSTLVSNGAAFDYTLPVPVDITGNFYIGVELPNNLSANIGIYTSAVDEPNTNFAWQQGSDNLWTPFSSSYSGNYCLAISALICQEGVPENPALAVNFQSNNNFITTGNSVSFFQMCNNSPISFKWYVSPIEGVTYVSNTSSTSSNPVIKFENPGSYTVSLTASNAHGSNSIIKSNYVTVSSLDISEQFSLEGLFQIFPNPTSDIINIEMKETEYQEEITIHIIDILGKKVINTNMPEGQNLLSIPITNLANGIYTIFIKSSSKTMFKKIIKK